jgi:hypothetical protein
MYMLRLSGSYEVDVTRRGTSNSPWTRKYSSASRGQEYRCSWLRHEHGDIEVCVHRYQTPLPVPITWSQELSALSGVMDGSRAHFVLLIINLGLSECANQRGVLQYARARVVERIPWWYFDLAVCSQRMAVPESISEVCTGSETWLRERIRRQPYLHKILIYILRNSYQIDASSWDHVCPVEMESYVFLARVCTLPPK